jgi:two-component system, OmpR family, sensor histidine kinase KdpD
VRCSVGAVSSAPRRSAWSGLLVAALAIAVITALIYPLKTVAPAVAMGVLYLIAVLAVATWWGLWLGLATAVASAVAFNYFHIPPTGRFSIASSDHAVALAAYLCSAALAAVVADRAGEAERRRAEADLKTTLLRSVSHDLRTPLTGIITAGHALRSPSLQPSERDELISSIVDEATRLSRLIDNLLDLSRLQAGAATPHTDWCSVEDVVRTAVERLGDVRVDVDLEPDLPMVRADAAQLERVFVNLLENARRHGAEPVVVTALVRDRRLEVRVVDAGPGIAADLRPFEPFVQGDGGEGSGLGLAIVKGFVEANGGRVWAEAPGHGAAFVVELEAP